MSAAINWSRQFQQDVGPTNEDGELEWDYQYHSYWFRLGDGRFINGVQYKDSPERCSFVRYYESDGQSAGQIQLDDFLEHGDLKAIARFLSETWQVSSIEVLTSDYSQPYKPIAFADAIASAAAPTFVELEQNELTSDFVLT